eukprot:2983682-Prymnesium_polylepis.1
MEHKANVPQEDQDAIKAAIAAVKVRYGLVVRKANRQEARCVRSCASRIFSLALSSLEFVVRK